MNSEIDEGVTTCIRRTDLGLIKELDTELVIWERSLPTGLREWIEQTEIISLPDLRILVRPSELLGALDPLLDECGLKAGNMRNGLVADINDLVIEFSNITRSDYVDVRLECVSHDACWKFHRDSVEIRLLTTYWGPGTEWVRRVQAEQAMQTQKGFKGPIEQLKNGDVAIFKGCGNSLNRGVVHRSPPISDTGLTRLLLCLNQRTVTSPEPWVES